MNDNHRYGFVPPIIQVYQLIDKILTYNIGSTILNPQQRVPQFIANLTEKEKVALDSYITSLPQLYTGFNWYDDASTQLRKLFADDVYQSLVTRQQHKLTVTIDFYNPTPDKIKGDINQAYEKFDEQRTQQRLIEQEKKQAILRQQQAQKRDQTFKNLVIKAKENIQFQKYHLTKASTSEKEASAFYKKYDQLIGYYEMLYYNGKPDSAAILKVFAQNIPPSPKQKDAIIKFLRYISHELEHYVGDNYEKNKVIYKTSYCYHEGYGPQACFQPPHYTLKYKPQFSPTLLLKKSYDRAFSNVAYGGKAIEEYLKLPKSFNKIIQPLALEKPTLLKDKQSSDEVVVPTSAFKK
jgi:hypothetical protein